MAIIINKKLTEENINYSELIDCIGDYYKLLNEGKVSVTNRIFTPTKDEGLHIIGAATNFETESYIVMAQTVMPWLRNTAQPVAMTSYIYSSFRTGEVKAFMGGTDIVRFRTPAKTVLAAKYLAPKKEEYIIGLVGLNIQAVTHANAFNSVFNVKKFVVNSRTPEKWQKNIDAIKANTGKEVEILSKDEVVEQSDILVLITSAKEVLVEYNQLHKGQLVISTEHAETVSRDTAQKVDKVFVDYRPTAENEMGTIKAMLDSGAKYEEIVDGDLMDLVTGKKVRESEDEIIFFQSLGVMNENLATVEYLYKKLEGKAQNIDL